MGLLFDTRWKVTTLGHANTRQLLALPWRSRSASSAWSLVACPRLGLVEAGAGTGCDASQRGGCKTLDVRGPFVSSVGQLHALTAYREAIYPSICSRCSQSNPPSPPGPRLDDTPRRTHPRTDNRHLHLHLPCVCLAAYPFPEADALPSLERPPCLSQRRELGRTEYICAALGREVRQSFSEIYPRGRGGAARERREEEMDTEEGTKPGAIDGRAFVHRVRGGMDSLQGSKAEGKPGVPASSWAGAMSFQTPPRRPSPVFFGCW